MKYLAIFECPPVGTAAEILWCESDREADDRAWEISCNNREYVNGSYDLYRIGYNPITHDHELTRVEPADEATDYGATLFDLGVM